MEPIRKIDQTVFARFRSVAIPVDGDTTPQKVRKLPLSDGSDGHFPLTRNARREEQNTYIIPPMEGQPYAYAHGSETTVRTVRATQSISNNGDCHPAAAVTTRTPMENSVNQTPDTEWSIEI